MNTTAKLGAYALGLAAALGGGAAVGAAAGPIDTGEPAPHGQHDDAPTTPVLPAGGLQVADAGQREGSGLCLGHRHRQQREQQSQW
ncbi:MAG: hypothetical protein OSA99_20875 [Acidimicrobiales bacterium]|nr:hypothetical protein [Acidimicrobiales bacterium]